MTDPTPLKDLHNPFSVAASSFMNFRHMDMYNGLPAHILHHFSPQFLHPTLPFTSHGEEFRPFVELKEFQSPSAFAPPNKCLKIMSQNKNYSLFSAHNNAHAINHIFPSTDERGYIITNQGRETLSPTSASLSPSFVSYGSRPGSGMASSRSTPGPIGFSKDNSLPSDQEGVKQEDLENSVSDSIASDQKYTPDSGSDSASSCTEVLMNSGPRQDILQEQGFRVVTNKSVNESSCCPVCGVCLETSELDSHFVQELERLCKLSHPSCKRVPAIPNDVGDDHRWETFQRIQNSRQDRLRTKIRKRKIDEATCPICQRILQRTPEELNIHVADCLKKHGMSGGLSTHQEDVDTPEGNSKMFSEEDWTDNICRSKISGFLFSGVSVPSKNNERSGLEPQNLEPEDGDTVCEVDPEGDDDEEDLIVDGDDSRVHTTPNIFSNYMNSETQSKENKREHCVDSEPRPSAEKDDTDRERLSPEGEQESQVATINSSVDIDVNIESKTSDQCDNDVTTSEAKPVNRNQLLNELKSRIWELENKDSDEDFKCFVCSHNKNNECPQCSTAISSENLRIVYM